MAVTCASPTALDRTPCIIPAGQANSRKKLLTYYQAIGCLLIEDKRGQTPLEYVRPDTLVTGLILESHKESLFPRGGFPPLESLRAATRWSRTGSTEFVPTQLASCLVGAVTPEEVLDLSPGMRSFD
jgi:hypothetical protein